MTVDDPALFGFVATCTTINAGVREMGASENTFQPGTDAISSASNESNVAEPSSSSHTRNRRGRRHRSRPVPLKRHSSLAELAREHKLQSRNSSTNDTRKFFKIESPDADAEESTELYATDSSASLLPHRSGGVSTPEDPNFLYRTGSHVFFLAGQELGDSRHNSPIHSAVHSASNSRDVSSDEDEVTGADSSGSETSNPERVIQFELLSSVDSSSESLSDDSSVVDPSTTSRPVLRDIILRDVLGFDLTKPSSVEAKQKDREKTTGVFDPALALALVASYVF